MVATKDEASRASAPIVDQGDVFWVAFPEQRGSETGYRRPAVIVQSQMFNRSAIGTVVICPITTNLRLAQAPGNVRLAKGEANLPRRSVVNVSQVAALARERLRERLGTVSKSRLREIFAGLLLVLSVD